MDNRVGHLVPSEAEVKKLVGDVEHVIERLARFTVVLSTEERKAVLRWRPGGEAVVERVGALVDRHGIVLPGVSHAEMDADLKLARVLSPLASAAERLARLVDDTVLEAQGECWWAATAYYTALARVASTNPGLEGELRDIVEFFALGRRKPASTPAPAPVAK